MFRKTATLLVLIIFFVSITLISSAENAKDLGYKNGYKKGYIQGASKGKYECSKYGKMSKLSKMPQPTVSNSWSVDYKNGYVSGYSKGYNEGYNKYRHNCLKR
jgi:flagellar biosynthesis/type III secretory pathway protein FliH